MDLLPKYKGYEDVDIVQDIKMASHRRLLKYTIHGKCLHNTFIAFTAINPISGRLLATHISGRGLFTTLLDISRSNRPILKI